MTQVHPPYNNKATVISWTISWNHGYSQLYRFDVSIIAITISNIAKILTSNALHYRKLSGQMSIQSSIAKWIKINQERPSENTLAKGKPVVE
jgi:hypothetical protein